MNNIENRKWLHQRLQKEGYDIGDYDSFEQSLQDKENVDWYYDKSKKLGLDVGDRNEFDNLFVEQKSVEPYTHVYNNQGKLVGGTAYEGEPVAAPYSAERASLKEQVADNNRKFPKMEDLPWTKPQGGVNGHLSTNDLASRLNQAYKEGGMEPFLHSNEDKKVNAQYTPKKEEKAEDVWTNAANKFLLTERGSQLQGELAQIQDEITNKYLDEFKNSDEYKAYAGQKYTSQAELDEANKVINNLFITKYGEAINNDLQPYQQAYNNEMLSRYGVEVESGLNKIAKNEAAVNLGKLSTSVNSELESIEKKIQDRTKAVRNENWKPGMPSSRDDQELARLRGERTYLDGAQELIEDSEHILQAAKDEKDGTFVGGVLRGASDKLFDVDTWTMGVSDLVGNLRMKNVLEKADKGEKLTKAEEALLDAAVNNMAINAYYRSDLGRGYKAGEVTGKSLPFMLEFIINPISSSGNAIAQSLLSYGLKRFGIKTIGKNATKATARFIGDMAAASGMVATTGMPGVLGETVDRMNRDYKYGVDEEGNLNIIKEGDTSFGEALGKSATTRFLENQSEMIFYAFKGASKMMKGVNEVHPGGVNGFMDALKNSKVGQLYLRYKNNPRLKEFRDAAKVGGIGEEYLEEVYNNFANVALGEMSYEDAVSLDKNIDTLLGLAPTQVLFSAWGLGSMAYERHKNRKDMERAFGLMSEEQKRKLEELQKMGKLSYNKDIAFFIRETIADQSLTPEQRRAEIEYAYDLAKKNAINDIAEAEVEDQVATENAQIDAATDPQTGLYGEVNLTSQDLDGNDVVTPANVFGEKVVDGETYLLVQVEGEAEKKWVRPNEYDAESYEKRPAEEVKALNEEMIREEAAQQAELESKYAPEVLKAEMKQDVPFIIGDEHFTPVGIMPEGNGWVVDVREIDENGKVAEKAHDVIELTYDEYRKKLQAQLEAQEAAQEQIAAEEQQAAAPEVVEENVTEEVAQPIQPTEESVIKENFTTETGNNLSPVEEVAQPQTEVQPQAPVIPTKKDGSIDFVTYGKDNSFKELGNLYGEKMPHKVEVTAKALAEDVIKAQQAVEKAQLALDNAPIGRDSKQKQALEKAQNELAEVQKEASFWNEMDADIKKAQAERESMLNPQAEVNMSEEPMDASEFVAQHLANGNIALTSESFKKETGYGETERKKFMRIIRKAENGGMTVEQAAEKLVSLDNEGNGNFFGNDTQAARDAIIDMLSSAQTWGDIANYVKNNREAMAAKESEGLREELEEAVMQNYHTTLEDYVLQNEVAEVDNPFDGFDIATKDAIFAEAEEEYQRYLKEQENGQTEGNIAEGSGSVLSEEQADNTGRTEERQEQGDGISQRPIQESEGSHPSQQEVTAEEKRRIPLRQRANEWAKALGVKVTFIESIDEVDPITRAQIEAEHAIGNTTPGWVARNGELFFFMPDLQNINDVNDTYVHEVVAHIGMERLLGKERYAEVCDKVWEMMPQSEKDYYEKEYPGVKEIKDDTTRHRRAADEYIAHLAEKENLTPEEKTIWDEIVKMVRELLDKALDGIIGKAQLTDADISELIKASYANLKSGKVEGGVSSEGKRFNAKKVSDRRQEKNRMNNTIDQAVALVMGQDVKEAKADRLKREQKRKEDAAEIYESVLSGDFNDVTLQKINDYIDDSTPLNPFGRRISQRLPQKLERKLLEGARTNIVDALFSRISESAVPASRRASEEGRREIEERKKEALKGWAIATNNWYTDLSAFTDETEPFGEGTDSKVYAAKEDGYVIKTSFGKPMGKRFRPDIDTVVLFNRVFPNSPYEIVGYGEFDGKFARILKQPAIDFAEVAPLTIEERVEYMRSLGFEPINEAKTAFSNGEIIAADIQKSNIVKDAEGNVTVIDADMKLHTKDVGGNYTYPPVETDLPENPHFRVVYHGSGAEFDKFNHEKMGSGAGSQVFGWGTYVTESEQIGRDYANIGRKATDDDIKYSGDFGEYVGNDIITIAKSFLRDADYNLDKAKELVNDYLSKNIPESTRKGGEFLLGTNKNDWTYNLKRHLYKVEIPDEKRGNYIVWGNNVTDAAVKKVFDGIYDRLITAEEYDTPTAQRELNRELNDLKSGYGKGQPGIWSDLYGDISSYLGSDKDASLFLRSLGYVGIKYPAGTIYKGNYGNAHNYVIFDENDLKIVQHTRFRVYKSKDGKETKYKQLSLFDEGGEAVNDRNRPDNIQRESGSTLETLNRLRELQEGEICNVERKFTESKEFSFTRGEKVESTADVAYIFKSLEDEAVENSFVAIANGDNISVFHLGMGAQTETIVDTTAILAAVDRLGADKVFFVHNHPSGLVRCSQQDVVTYQRLKDVLGDKLEDGIIINTRSGKYGLFNSSGLVDENGKIKEEKNEYPINVYKFNKQSFNVDEIPSVSPSSYGIAEFVSTQRLGKRDKINALLLNNQFGCVGNILIDNGENTKAVVEKITNDAIAMGARQVVIYGRYPFVEVTDRKTNFVSYLSDAVNRYSQGNVRLIDIIQIDEPYSKSANDEGIRFRISPKGKQIQEEVDKFTSKYASKPVAIVDSEMTDEELEEAYPTSLAEDTRKKISEGKKGGYSPTSGKIHIFVDNVEMDEVENSLFHENLHKLFEGNPLINEFFERFDEERPEVAEEFRLSYDEADVPEETFVFLMSQGMVLGKLGLVNKYLSEQSKSEFFNKIKEFGYDYEQESARRNRRSNTGSDEDSKEVRSSRSGVQEVGEGTAKEAKPSPRERAERLKELFDKVADMGLEGVLGDGHYDKAMMDIYRELPEEARKIVADDALSTEGIDFIKAMDRFLNEKAEPSIWDKVTSVISEWLRKAGFNLELTPNEVKYIWWRSQKPLDRNNVIEIAEDAYKKYQLKVGEFEDSPNPDGDGGGTRFRVSNKLNVRDEYEATIKKGGYQAREAVQDAMLSLRRFQEMIEKASGEKIKDFENAWMHENRLSSMTQAEIHESERKFYKPMMAAVKKLMKVANMEDTEVADYLMLKHGIERNREMAVRKALTDADGKMDRTKLNAWYQEKEAIRNDASLDTWRKKQEAMDNAALNYGSDMSVDYSGLTSMFGTDDVAVALDNAYNEVEKVETTYPKEAESLGSAIKAYTQSTLDKSFSSGLMNREVYNELSKDMYDYYIPLRGFEETTSEEVYAYLDNERNAFNAPLKRAKGRTSKSDNPLAYMKSIAESGIMQGNRNMMKQTFLNMVTNHPSDLVSVRSGVWAVMNPATGEWEAIAPPPVPNDATPADVETIMEAWEASMEAKASVDPNVKKIYESDDVPYRVIGNRMGQHQVIVKRLGKSYTLTINGNPRLAMALNGLTNPNNKSNDQKAVAYVSNKIDAINRELSAWYTTRNPDFVASNFMRDTFYTNTIVRAKEGNKYANNFHKHYGKLLMPGKMIGLFKKYENGTLDLTKAIERDFYEFMMNGGETGYSNLKDLEDIKKQISKELKGSRLEDVKKVAEKLDILNRAVENTARFAAYRTSRQSGRSISRSVFDAKEISVNFNKKGAGGTFFGMTGQTKIGNMAAMVGAGGRAMYVFFNAAIQGTTNLMHVARVNPKGTSAGVAAMFLMGAVVPFLFAGDDDDEKNYYDIPEHVRRNHLIVPGAGDAWISIPLPIEYRIMYGMGELLTSWRTGHERGEDIARKMLNLTGQALPLNFIEEGLDAFMPSALSPLWQVYNNESWTGLPIYKDNEFNKNDPEYTKAYKNVDRTLYNISKALYEWTFDEENQEAGININPAVIESLAKGYFGGLATQLTNVAKTAEMIAGEREFDWRSIPVANRIFKSGDERTKEKRITNEYFENIDKLEFLQSRERLLNKTKDGSAVPQKDKDRAATDLQVMKDSEVYKKYMEFKRAKKTADKIYKKRKEKDSPELEKDYYEALDKANKALD